MFPTANAFPIRCTKVYPMSGSDIRISLERDHQGALPALQPNYDRPKGLKKPRRSLDVQKHACLMLGFGAATYYLIYGNHWLKTLSHQKANMMAMTSKQPFEIICSS